MDRRIEILICLLLLPMVVVLSVAVGVVVAVSLGRPVLFRQTRAGQGRAPFVLIKFRSLRDTRDAQGRLLPDAERMGRIGAGLRRMRLDELPQLFLILRGQMALVGPRPLLPETIQGFGAAGVRRCALRPGLTGWSQVSGNTWLTDEEKLALDLWYVAHRSLALDLRIVLDTLGVALHGEQRREARLAEAQRWRAQQVDLNGDVATSGQSSREGSER